MGNIAVGPRRARARQSLPRPGRAVSGSGAGGQRPAAGEWLRHVLVGVVGGAHEWARRDVVEAELVGGCLERSELIGVPVANDRQVAL